MPAITTLFQHAWEPALLGGLEPGVQGLPRQELRRTDGHRHLRLRLPSNRRPIERTLPPPDKNHRRPLPLRMSLLLTAWAKDASTEHAFLAGHVDDRRQPDLLAASTRTHARGSSGRTRLSRSSPPPSSPTTRCSSSGRSCPAACSSACSACSTYWCPRGRARPGPGGAVMIRPTERHSYRAPLALECVDGVTGAVISDGLTATGVAARRPGHPGHGTPLAALRAVGQEPPRDVAADARARATRGAHLLACAAHTRVRSDLDTRGRYLPTSIAVDVPVTEPFQVKLFYSPPGLSCLELRNGAGRSPQGRFGRGWAGRTSRSSAEATPITGGRPVSPAVFQMPWPDALSVPTVSCSRPA